MTSQTPEEDTTEIEDWKEEFWYKVAEWNNAQPEDIDIYANQLEILIEYHIKEQVHQQLQKHRKSWLREEKVFWKNKQVDVGDGDYCLICKQHIASGDCQCTTKNQALQTIIDRYQAELEGGLETNK